MLFARGFTIKAGQEMGRVLITGATGLCGQICCRKFLDEGLEVFAVVKDASSILPKGVNPLVLDLSRDWEDIVFPDGLNQIVHLAQSPYFREFPKNALDLFKVNIESTARLLDYGMRVGIERFVYASSGGVYGNGAQAFKENAPVVPSGHLGHYLGSKACSEMMIHNYASFFKVIILRPFFIYGPGQNKTMLLPRLFDRVAAYKPIQLQGSHGIRINPLHVEDASEAILRSSHLNESAIINLAGPEVLSIREICEAFGTFLGKTPVYEAIAESPSDLIGDISLMKTLLHEPDVRLRDALANLAW